MVIIQVTILLEKIQQSLIEYPVINRLDGVKLVLLDPNLRPLLQQWFETFESHESFLTNCTARQCSPLRRTFMECSISNPALSLLMKHLVIGQRQKPPNFSAFHWSPHGSLVSIGQNFVTTRVVHLPKRTETSLITESDQSGSNYHLLQLCTACTACSDSDQAVQAMHSCISWLLNKQ